MIIGERTQWTHQISRSLQILQIFEVAVAAGARTAVFARLLGVDLPTPQRWCRQFAVDGDSGARRKARLFHVSHRISKEELQPALLTRPSGLPES